jgi:hypothetical protein
MGIDVQSATAIAYLRSNGFVGREILSLGRQQIYATEGQLMKINKAFELGLSANDMKAIMSTTFADHFLAKLGFTTIQSMDASDYEGADFIHDMNQPLPKEFHGTVFFLFDGGTLEHVFDVATSLKNVISLLKVGGIVLFACPANSWCGHGFYQFSPEFFYRVLEANGFDDVVVYLTAGRRPRSRWLKTVDPRAAKHRVEFMSAEALLMIVIARKARNLPEFVNPMQSDYSDDAWLKSQCCGTVQKEDLKNLIHRQLKYRIAYPLQILLRHTTGFCFGTGVPGLWNPSLFQPINPFHHALFENFQSQNGSQSLTSWLQ